MGEAFDDPMFGLFVLGGTAVSLGAFALFALPLTFIAWRDPPALRIYRIQRRGPSHPGALVRRGVLTWLANNALLFGVLLAAWPLLRGIVRVHGGPVPPWYVVTGQVLFFIYLDDFLYYWMHRALHRQPWLWRRVHRWHHRIKTPWAVVGHDMHPAEFLATAGLMLVGPMVLGCHVLVLWIWIVIRQLEAAEGHCGYAFPISPLRFLPGADGPRHHDFHHAKVQGNYSGFLGWVDGVLGTRGKGYEHDHHR